MVQSLLSHTPSHQYEAKKAKKAAKGDVVIAKSNIILDVKVCIGHFVLFCHHVSSEFRNTHRHTCLLLFLLFVHPQPWDDETDMVEMEKRVREIDADGLVWGACE